MGVFDISVIESAILPDGHWRLSDPLARLECYEHEGHAIIMLRHRDGSVTVVGEVTPAATPPAPLAAPPEP